MRGREAWTKGGLRWEFSSHTPFLTSRKRPALWSGRSPGDGCLQHSACFSQKSMGFRAVVLGLPVNPAVVLPGRGFPQ